MKAPILVIMAAGMGSRFGGLKQMQPMDEQGHFLMDFSIYDALRAGFGKVVCIIKKEMEADFEALIGKRVRPFMELKYVEQNLAMLPEGYTIPEGRTKPWGTAHAVMCAVPELDAPFAVINADDFYGREAFEAMGRFLKEELPETDHAMVGYLLKNTLTENGSVSRGQCSVDEKGYLTGVVERTSIERKGDKVYYTENGEDVEIPEDTVVSMNMWGFRESLKERFEKDFVKFLRETMPSNPMKAEYFLPLIPNAVIAEGSGSVKVLQSDARWYGVTYQNDLPGVLAAIQNMKDTGVYPEYLWR
ncbi:MAG: nucleotidyltransferase [Oscillospiraceae bacterium]|nr:nucleotidyltransferase [Oscillospiraceae bacterium]